MHRLILPLLLILSARVPAQEIEDPGPFPVGWRSVTFQDQVFGQGTIRGRVYYPAHSAGRDTPADPSAGPYPLVAFQHGWLGAPDGYDDLCTHLASYGFVVASTGTQTGLFPDTAQYARDTRSFLHWVDGESQDPGSWLAGMAWSGEWGASGHSMGGGTLARLIGIESRIGVIIGLQSAVEGAVLPDQNMQAFPGRHYQIAGSVDFIVRTATVYHWFQNAVSASRNLFFEVQGMGHLGPTDTPPNNEPMPGADQHRLHRRLVTGIFRAEMLDEQDLFVDVLGEGISVEAVLYQSDCVDPPFWAVESQLQAGNLAVGMAAEGGDRALLAWSLVPGSVPTQFGELGLDPAALVVFQDTRLSAFGFLEELLPIQSGWSGQTVYLQGLPVANGSGQLSRVVSLSLP